MKRLTELPTENLLVLRIVISACLISWFLKGQFFFYYLFEIATRYPIRHNLFPDFFLSNYISQIAYIFPALMVPLILTKRRLYFIFSGLTLVMSSVVLMLHINTYNDATFVVNFWVGLWILWFAWQASTKSDQIVFHACFLAKLIVGVIFMGGMVGKLTESYLDGTVIYEIFFSQASHWPFDMLKHHFSDAQRFYVAGVTTKLIMIVEFMLAFAVVWPRRILCILGPILMCGIILFSTWRILSVLMPLQGLLLACLVLTSSTHFKTCES